MKFITLVTPDEDGDAKITINVSDIILFGEPNKTTIEKFPRANAFILIRDYPKAGGGIPVIETPEHIGVLISRRRQVG